MADRTVTVAAVAGAATVAVARNARWTVVVATIAGQSTVVPGVHNLYQRFTVSVAGVGAAQARIGHVPKSFMSRHRRRHTRARRC